MHEGILMSTHIKFEPAHDKTYNKTCATSEDSFSLLSYPPLKLKPIKRNRAPIICEGYIEKNCYGVRIPPKVAFRHLAYYSILLSFIYITYTSLERTRPLGLLGSYTIYENRAPPKATDGCCMFSSFFSSVEVAKWLALPTSDKRSRVLIPLAAEFWWWLYDATVHSSIVSDIT